MEAQLKQIYDFYEWALTQGDPRVKNWPLMNFELMVVITISYLVILFLLVKFMKTRAEPFKLKKLALVHNIFLVSLSAYMFIEIVHQWYINNYIIWGNGVDRSPKGNGMASVIWLFYVSKVPEFMDTFMMALKKNFRQITFLHVYHHASIFVLWWIITYYTPGGDAYFSAMLNSFVHIVMYSYYLWSTYARKLSEGEKPRWTHPGYYRKYITLLQLTQFCLMFSQATHGLFFPSPIPFASFFAWMLFLYMLTMLALFGNFFYQQYTKKKPKSGKVTAASEAQVNGHTNGHAGSNGYTNGRSKTD